MVTKRSLSSKRSSNKKGESLLYGNKKDVRGKKKEIENVLAPRPEWRDCFGIIQLSEDDLSELKESKRDWNIFQKWREEKRIGFWNGTVWISDMDSKAYKWFEKVLGGGLELLELVRGKSGRLMTPEELKEEEAEAEEEAEEEE